MGEDGMRSVGLSSGLAVLLKNDDKKESSSISRLVSYSEDFGHQSAERTLEHIFDIPLRSLGTLARPIVSGTISSIINNEYLKYHGHWDGLKCTRDGISVSGTGHVPHAVMLDNSSVCGDIGIVKPPLLIESLALFSSVRANVCVWSGKWMYEVTLETAGIQQLGWATISCPFTDHMGVGDSEDSYAYDGRRVSKWNKKPESYGQLWVAGDIIGCCIDLEHAEISFYRNGVPLGVAFSRIHKIEPGVSYYPAVSLSQGEQCGLNFGAYPFRYPIDGFMPLQAPPSLSSLSIHLLQCLKRLFEMQRAESCDCSSVHKLRRLMRFIPFEELFHPVSRAICEKLISTIDAEPSNAEYIGRGPMLSLVLEIFGVQAPHDYSSLDKFVDLLLEFQGSLLILKHIIDALSHGCKTAPLVLTECPYSAAYPYLALACHILRHEQLMLLWWRSSSFELLFEGFLSWKNPNKQDLECMMPSVWWPGANEDMPGESSMALITTAISGAINKIEEQHRDLCRLVIQYSPHLKPPGSIFRTFLHNVLFKYRGADRISPPSGFSSDTVLVSLYTVILHFLSEGFCSWLNGYGAKSGSDIGFLHRGGKQKFPVSLFLDSEHHRIDISRLGGSLSHLSRLHPIDEKELEIIEWEEGYMDDKISRVTHSTWKKPCCCSSFDNDYARISKAPVTHVYKNSHRHSNSISERAVHVTSECSAESLNDDIADKPSSSNHSGSEYQYHSAPHIRCVPRESNLSVEILREEELLDAMLLLYHLGLAPNFKQASYFMSQQSQSLSLLEITDRQIRDGACGEHLKHLKEARNIYREEVLDSVRHCAWYRVKLCSRWKQRGMYATCIWSVQLLLILSKMEFVFNYVPEFYLESLVDCFHVLRKSDPPFVPSAIFIKQGLASFVTFIVTHFNDPRISSADLRDLLLQSISVLIQYKEFLAAFESNEVATQRMPKALLSAFDNRSWIPVTNILLRLCKGFGFGLSKHGESSSSSFLFQRLLREACLDDEELFSAFLNRLFNTLSWTVTEFSITICEIQEKYQVLEFHQRKCSVIFDLSCNLARVLEFCTHEIPQAFLLGTDTNLRRLAELIVFILNHVTSVADAEFHDLSLRRNGQSSEKVNRGMLLAPLVGIMSNLLDARMDAGDGKQNDVVKVFASMDCFDTVYCGFQYLLEYNWAGSLRDDAYQPKLMLLDSFSNLLICQAEGISNTENGSETDLEENMCCICYARVSDAQFNPCSHRSCNGCITRHLLNCQRCFFCNATVVEISRIKEVRREVREENGGTGIEN
uniref:RING-type E3 ubiquitin transferase n=1 Tax=Kalanchoe fedtschenkoi TaxID=63787 RepID=A0A7N0U317_KALFE